MELKITRRPEEDTIALAVSGEVDVSNAAELRSVLDEILDCAASVVEVDLSEVPYIDSTGIGVFVGAAHRAKDAEKRIAVVRPQHNVMRVLGLLGLQDELGVVE